MKTPKRLALTYNDINLIPQFSSVKSRLDVKLTTKLGSHEYNPIMTSPMDTISSGAMLNVAQQAGCVGIAHRFQSLPERFLELPEMDVHGVAIGMNDHIPDILVELKKKPAHLCFDIAHADTSYAHKYIKDLLITLDHENFYGINVIAGSVCTFEATQDICELNLNQSKNFITGIRAGIGGGSICSTRLVTGHGIPMVDTILQCREAIDNHSFNCYLPGHLKMALIADGGITGSGDAAKALACGANFVMVGSMLSGTDETPGVVVEKQPLGANNINYLLGATPLYYKKYRGMASREVQDEKLNGVKPGTVPEGIEVLVEYKGRALNIFDDILGGLRSAFTYSGAKNLKEFYEKSEFVQVTNSGIIEASTHITNKGTAND